MESNKLFFSWLIWHWKIPIQTPIQPVPPWINHKTPETPGNSIPAALLQILHGQRSKVNHQKTSFFFLDFFTGLMKFILDDVHFWWCFSVMFFQTSFCGCFTLCFFWIARARRFEVLSRRCACSSWHQTLHETNHGSRKDYMCFNMPTLRQFDSPW